MDLQNPREIFFKNDIYVVLYCHGNIRYKSTFMELQNAIEIFSKKNFPVYETLEGNGNILE